MMHPLQNPTNQHWMVVSCESHCALIFASNAPCTFMSLQFSHFSLSSGELRTVIRLYGPAERPYGHLAKRSVAQDAAPPGEIKRTTFFPSGLLQSHFQVMLDAHLLRKQVMTETIPATVCSKHARNVKL